MAIGDLVINDDKTVIGCVVGKSGTSGATWSVTWSMSDRVVTTFHYTQEIQEMRRKLKRYMDKANANRRTCNVQGTL